MDLLPFFSGDAGNRRLALPTPACVRRNSLHIENSSTNTHPFVIKLTGAFKRLRLADGVGGHAGGSAQGYAPDVEIQYKELKRVEDLLHEMLAQHTGQSVEQIAADFDRDRFMTAEEAVEYGLVDQILQQEEKE